MITIDVFWIITVCILSILARFVFGFSSIFGILAIVIYLAGFVFWLAQKYPTATRSERKKSFFCLMLLALLVPIVGAFSLLAWLFIIIPIWLLGLILRHIFLPIYFEEKERRERQNPP